jgi:fucose 4-O-acetylase-like acetyltransferase
MAFFLLYFFPTNHSSKDVFTMTRIVSIDFTKGILVLVMVIYHSLNYLQYGTVPHNWLRFLPPSFIMITGFIVSHMYKQKYKEDFRVMSLRLGIRALKILLIFIALNVMTRLIWSANHYGVPLYFENFKTDMINIFLIGVPWISAFDILLPISYTLAAAVIVTRVQSFLPSFPLILAAAVFLFCTILENSLELPYNLTMLSAGFIGMAAGLLPQGILSRFRPPWSFIMAAVILYIVLVRFIEDRYYTQMLTTVVSLTAILSVGSRVDPASVLTQQITMVGRYSLISYIAQIFFLQFIRPATIIINVQMVLPLTLITIVMFLTWVIVLITDYSKRKYRCVNVLYNIILS